MMSRFSAPHLSWEMMLSSRGRRSTGVSRRMPNSCRPSSTQNRSPSICSIHRARTKPGQWRWTQWRMALSPTSRPACSLWYQRSRRASSQDSSARLRHSTVSSTGMAESITESHNSRPDEARAPAAVPAGLGKGGSTQLYAAFGVRSSHPVWPRVDTTDWYRPERGISWVGSVLRAGHSGGHLHQIVEKGATGAQVGRSRGGRRVTVRPADILAPPDAKSDRYAGPDRLSHRRLGRELAAAVEHGDRLAVLDPPLRRVLWVDLHRRLAGRLAQDVHVHEAGVQERRVRRGHQLQGVLRRQVRSHLRVFVWGDVMR